MPVDIVLVTSYLVTIIATLVLSMYFFRDYARKRLRASLTWGLGLLLYDIGVLGDFSVEVFGEITIGKPGLLAALLITVVGMCLLYYGASLLFFSAGSFFRERITAVFFAVFAVFAVYLTATLPIEGFRELAAARFQLGPFLFIYLIIALLFYRVSRRLPTDDPRKMTVLIVSSAWFLHVIVSIYRGAFLHLSSSTDALFEILLAVAWILILYGMALGKAAKA